MEMENSGLLEGLSEEKRYGNEKTEEDEETHRVK